MLSLERKKISVITPTFNLIKGNRKDVFIEMFKSVHAQTYPNIEHIIIDGGSKDGTIELINELIKQSGTKDVKIISEPDNGITDASIKGFNNSSGDYVIIMNSDDYYMCNDALELLANAIERKNVDYACADCWWLCRDTWIADISSFAYRHPFVISTWLVKRWVFEKYGHFKPDLKIVADFELFFRILKQDDVTGTEVHKTLTCLRPGGASQSNEKLFVKETLNGYRSNLQGQYSDDEIKALHWGYVSSKLIDKIKRQEKNRKIIESVMSLKNMCRPYGILRKRILNIVFLHFLFRPIKRMLGIKKVKKLNMRSYSVHTARGANFWDKDITILSFDFCGDDKNNNKKYHYKISDYIKNNKKVILISDSSSSEKDIKDFLYNEGILNDSIAIYTFENYKQKKCLEKFLEHIAEKENIEDRAIWLHIGLRNTAYIIVSHKKVYIYNQD